MNKQSVQNLKWQYHHHLRQSPLQQKQENGDVKQQTGTWTLAIFSRDQTEPLGWWNIPAALVLCTEEALGRCLGMAARDRRVLTWGRKFFAGEPLAPPTRSKQDRISAMLVFIWKERTLVGCVLFCTNRMPWNPFYRLLHLSFDWSHKSYDFLKGEMASVTTTYLLPRDKISLIMLRLHSWTGWRGLNYSTNFAFCSSN